MLTLQVMELGRYCVGSNCASGPTDTVRVRTVHFAHGLSRMVCSEQPIVRVAGRQLVVASTRIVGDVIVATDMADGGNGVWAYVDRIDFGGSEGGLNCVDIVAVRLGRACFSMVRSMAASSSCLVYMRTSLFVPRLCDMVWLVATPMSRVTGGRAGRLAQFADDSEVIESSYAVLELKLDPLMGDGGGGASPLRGC